MHADIGGLSESFIYIIPIAMSWEKSRRASALQPEDLEREKTILETNRRRSTAKS